MVSVDVLKWIRLVIFIVNCGGVLMMLDRRLGFLKVLGLWFVLFGFICGCGDRVFLL